MERSGPETRLMDQLAAAAWEGEKMRVSKHLNSTRGNAHPGGLAMALQHDILPLPKEHQVYVLVTNLSEEWHKTTSNIAEGCEMGLRGTETTVTLTVQGGTHEHVAGRLCAADLDLSTGLMLTSQFRDTQ